MSEEEAICERKVTYASKKIAKIIAKKNKAGGGNIQDAYRCPACEKWHLTHKQKASYKRRVRE